MSETAAIAATARIFLDAVDQWARKFNTRMEAKYGGDVAEDTFQFTDRLRIALREALNSLEEDE